MTNGDPEFERCRFLPTATTAANGRAAVLAAIGTSILASVAVTWALLGRLDPITGREYSALLQRLDTIEHKIDGLRVR